MALFSLTARYSFPLLVLPLDSPQRHFLERYELINGGVTELAPWSCFSLEEDEGTLESLLD